jgi:hypothetical protein
LHLASRVRCIAIDYPGAQTAALADGLAALLDTLGDRPGKTCLAPH